MGLNIRRIWKIEGLYNLKMRAYLPEFHFGTREHMLLPQKKHFDKSKNYQQKFLAYISTSNVRTSNFTLNRHFFGLCKKDKKMCNEKAFFLNTEFFHFYS